MLTACLVLCLSQLSGATSPTPAQTPVYVTSHADGDRASSTTVAPEGALSPLTISAGLEAKGRISGFLGGSPTDLQLIFIYFDLVLNDTEYHPGACPSDGKSAADADTPLKWALVRTPDGRNVNEQDNFARAYLSLPLGFPRVYSLGRLEGNYVRYVSHGKYKMKMEVNEFVWTNWSSWSSLSSERKAELVRMKIGEFLNELKSNATSSWKLCYSDPRKYFSSFFWGAVMTPSYQCEAGDPKNPPQQLEATGMLKAFYVLLVSMSSVLALAHLRSFFSLTFLTDWGTESNDKLTCDDEGRIQIKGNFLSENRLPGHTTVGGLLASNWLLGHRAFYRLKYFLFVISRMWPYILVVIISLAVLSPQLSESDEPSYRVLQEDSFVECYGFGRNRLMVTAFSTLALFFSILAASMAVYAAILTWTRSAPVQNSKDQRFLKVNVSLGELGSRSSRALTSIFSFLVLFIRTTLSWPGKPKDCSNDSRPKPRLSVKKSVPVFFAATFVWITVLIGSFICCCVGILIELFLLVSSPFHVDFDSISGSQHRSHRKFFFLLWKYTMLGEVVLFWAYTSFVIAFEFSSFVSLTFIGLYINYQLQFFTGISWVAALFIETRKALESYRSPLRVIRKIYTDEVKTILKEQDAFEGFLMSSDGDFASENLQLYLKSKSSPGTCHDWEHFLLQAPRVFQFACLQVLRQPGWKMPASRVYCPAQPRAAKPVCSQRLKDIDLVSSMSSKLSDPKVKSAEDRLRMELQYFLKVRLARTLAEFLGLLTVVLTLFTLLFGFGHLFSSDGVNSINSILFQLFLIPTYTYVRSAYSSPPLDESQLLLVGRIIKANLQQVLRDSEQVRQSLCNLDIGSSSSVHHMDMRRISCDLKFRAVSRSPVSDDHETA